MKAAPRTKRAPRQRVANMVVPDLVRRGVLRSRGDLFRETVKRHRESEAAMVKAAHEAFPVGTEVRYRHGEHWRYGTVVMLGYGARMRLTSPNGKLVWQEAVSLELVR